TDKKFFVQVGAFTSKERAQSFVKENQAKIDYEMSISFRDQVQLYVVLLSPFATREDAESVRNSLRQIASFKDAFIITEK
ncbi:MAG: SPOR domain-containing protein, partial [Bacteroidota bacterium]